MQPTKRKAAKALRLAVWLAASLISLIVFLSGMMLVIQYAYDLLKGYWWGIVIYLLPAVCGLVAADIAGGKFKALKASR